MVIVGGIETKLLPRSQHVSKHTGKMNDRTEDVKREWQKDKEQDLIYEKTRRGRCKEE